MTGSGTARDLLSPRFIVGRAEQRLGELQEQLRAHPADYCAIVEQGSDRFSGLLSFRELALQPAIHDRILADLVDRTHSPPVTALAPLQDVLEHIRRSGTGAVPVTDQEGRFIGVITPESLAAWLLAEEQERRDDLMVLLDERRSLAAFLEQKVEERTERLKAAMEDANRFAFSLSHDLRGPLRTLRAYTALLLDGEEGPVAPNMGERLQRIQHLATKLEVFADGLLDRARRAAGSPEASGHSAIDLNEIYNDALAFHASLLESRKARIVKRAPLHTIRGRYVLALQILGNLITNAVKSVPLDRIPEIEIWTDEGAHGIVLSVKDNGAGMAEAERERIFLPFVSGTAHEGGVGLGLTLIQRAAADLEGNIEFDSVLNEGSTFRVRLKRTG